MPLDRMLTLIPSDDGPQLASPVLYDFLKSQNQTATHFLIGSRKSSTLLSKQTFGEHN